MNGEQLYRFKDGQIGTIVWEHPPHLHRNDRMEWGLFRSRAGITFTIDASEVERIKVPQPAA